MTTRLRVFACALALFSGQAFATVIFVQDFEAGLGASESVDGLFTINQSNVLNNGTQMMGHATSTSHNEHSSYYLTLDLTQATNTTLQFDYVASIEDMSDGFNAVVEGVGVIPVISGITYDPQTGFTTPFTTGGDLYYDSDGSIGDSGTALLGLSGFDGSMVTVRFQYGSNGSVTTTGFNLDNVVVRADVIPEPASLLLIGLGLAGMSLFRLRRSV